MTLEITEPPLPVAGRRWTYHKALTPPAWTMYMNATIVGHHSLEDPSGKEEESTSLHLKTLFVSRVCGF
jgi:hypothetical protein